MTTAVLDDTDTDGTSPAAAAVAAVAAAIDRLLAADLTFPGDNDMLDLLRGVEVQTRRLHAASVRVTAQIIERGLAAPAGGSSVAALLRQVLPLSPADAAQRVRLAGATCPTTGLTGASIPPVLPLLAVALSAGSMGAAQAATIVSTMTGLPADVPAELRESVEGFLVEQAAVLDPKTLHNMARRIALMANPDGPYDERDATEKQEFHIGARRDDGLTRCWGLLDDLTVEALRAALGALCSPAAERNHRTGRPDPDTSQATHNAATDGAAMENATMETEPGDERPGDEEPTGTSETGTGDPAPADEPAPRQPWRPTRPPYEWAPLGTIASDYPPPPSEAATGPPDQPQPLPEDRRSAATRRAPTPCRPS